MKYYLINSDVYAGLINLKDKSIDIAITSPPYWGQRDYGFAGQIGNEPTYQEYIAKLVKIFNVLRNKLKKNGVFFLNIGDKYLSKYGKSPLGFIPFKLAYEMVRDGWHLNDILIWYKPNHMPSSIKNRFTNSYEPVFVLSPNEKNIFKDFIKENPNYSNILKINLQPTPYKHVAVYPEKLVEELLKLVNKPDSFTILDPFAGSGTTLKVVKVHYPFAKAFMIEYNNEYIDIIKERCNLKNDFTIKKYNFIPYQYNTNHYSYNTSEQLSLFEKKYLYHPSEQINGITEITKSKEKYYELLEKFENQSIRKKIKPNGICFIGCLNYNLDLIVRTAELNEKGWIIRNMLVVEKNNKWFPIFMIVDDNKFVDYVFHYKKLDLKPKSNNNKDWKNTNFVGYHVYDNISKQKREGIIIDVLETYEDYFPKFVAVYWDNSKITKEFIIKDQEEVDSKIKIVSTEFVNHQNSANGHFVIQYKEKYFDLGKDISNENYKDIKLTSIYRKNNYNGKFKDTIRKNWGASPGARASLVNEYFSLQRLFSVNQKLVANYLNSKRIEKGFSKSEFTNLFPLSYKHTVGHWLRTDFGGSIPTPDDWEIIASILDIDEEFTYYVCTKALKLQSVMHSKYKMPDDFIDYKFIPELKKLYE